MSALVTALLLCGVTCFITEILTRFYLPLSLLFVLRRPGQDSAGDCLPITVIVPAYNEGKVIGRCVESILASDYPNLEAILVDDGSTDDTLPVMLSYTRHPNVIVISQPNTGKASAINRGLDRARGDFVLLVDANGVFAPDTVRRMLTGFTSGRVGAVCGNDAPINLNRIQTRLISIQTHVSTAATNRSPLGILDRRRFHPWSNDSASRPRLLRCARPDTPHLARPGA